MATEASSQMVMRAKLEELASLERWVAAQAVELILPPPLASRIDLCLTEHVTNIIDYGYPNRAPGTIIMSLWHQPEEIVVRIDDDGAPFDPTACALPALPRSLADAKGGGRGIRLVRHFADELHYMRTAAGNELVLKFRIGPAPR
jgi:anti-sigma regulatory factor (Ser/Thr protein kinase)